MRSTSASITDLPISPELEQRRRMRQYVVAMSIRMACLLATIVLAIVAPGWWILIPVVGAVFLPYFAVVIANAPVARRGDVERPGAAQLPAAPGPEHRP